MRGAAAIKMNMGGLSSQIDHRTNIVCVKRGEGAEAPRTPSSDPMVTHLYVQERSNKLWENMYMKVSNNVVNKVDTGL